MTIAIAALGTAFASDTDAQTYQRTFTPADSSVVFLQTTARAASAPGSPTIADTAGLTWVSVANVTFNVLRTRLWYAIVSGTSPGSLTATVDWRATVQGCSMGMVSVTGGSLGAPLVGSAATNTGTSTTPGVGTVSALAQAGNARLLFTSAARSAGGFSPEASSSWSELWDVGGVTPVQGQAAYSLVGSDDTTPTSVITSSVAWAAIAVELALASSPPDPFVTVQFRGS